MAEESSESEQEDGLNSTDNGNPLVEKTERDLQLIFRKLRVNSEPKRLKMKLKMKCLRRDDHSKRQNKTFTERRIIKEASFIYKSLSTKQKPSHLVKDSEKKDPTKTIPFSKMCNTNLPKFKHEHISPESKSPPESCSGQFRRAQCSSVPRNASLNFDDTTPEELAAYFEQLLHIPKPMSAMAEMMYT